MHLPNVPVQIVTPALFTAPLNWADSVLAWYILSESVVLVVCPDMAADVPRKRPTLAASRDGASTGPGMFFLMLSACEVLASIRHRYLGFLLQGYCCSGLPYFKLMCGSVRAWCEAAVEYLL